MIPGSDPDLLTASCSCTQRLCAFVWMQATGDARNPWLEIAVFDCLLDYITLIAARQLCIEDDPFLAAITEYCCTLHAALTTKPRKRPTMDCCLGLQHWRRTISEYMQEKESK